MLCVTFERETGKCSGLRWLAGIWEFDETNEEVGSEWSVEN